MKVKFFEDVRIPTPSAIDAEVEEIVAKALLSLTPQEQVAMSSCYGIQTELKTLSEIGRTLGLSRSRVGHIRDKAIRKLMYPGRSTPLMRGIEAHVLASKCPEAIALLRQRDSLEKKVEDLEAEVTSLKAEIARLVWPTECLKILLRPIDELNLSQGAAGYLRNWKLHYIGDLVRENETDLLKKLGSGRKRLNEIKEVLASRGLTLGMKLPQP